MQAIRHLAILMFVWLLSACAAPTLSPDKAVAIKRVGVVSLLPQEVKYRKIGITVFNNEYKSLPAGDVFNTTARASVERYLRSSGKYEVKQIEVDTLAMAAKLNGRGMVMAYSVEHIDAEVAELAKKHNVDAVIIVGERFDGERGIFGLTMSLYSGLSEIRRAWAMAGLQTFGLTPDKDIFMAQSPPPSLGVQLSRPDGKPWSYKLEENLDATTHQYVIKELQQAVEGAVSASMTKSGL